MVDDNQTEKAESLGEYLRRLRKEKKYEQKDVTGETKIPPQTLRAMERDDYQELPAEAFARGFYILYAKFLDLDPQEILERYSKERADSPALGISPPPSRQGRKVNTLAAKSSVAPGSSLGFILVLLILLGAILCYHFSWNPATFLSEKLRNLQPTSTTETQPDSSTGNGATTYQNETEFYPGDQYVLTANFAETTTATLSIDNSFPEERSYPKGSSQNWQAEETLTLILPENAKVHLFLNGTPLHLPEAAGRFITLNLP